MIREVKVSWISNFINGVTNAYTNLCGYPTPIITPYSDIIPPFTTDPLFKAVLKVRPRLPQGTTAESTAITKQSPLPSSIHQTQAAADGIDSELDDDERERRRMERQEMKRRQKAVLAARAEEAAIRAREEGQASVKREELERGGEWDPKAIWTDEEVPHRDLTEDDYKDDRTEPEYVSVL